MSEINHFLMVFDHAKDELVEVKEFGTDIEKATRAYSEREGEYKNSSRFDIVLVGSDSIETVKVTHGTYFEGFHKRSFFDSFKAVAQ